MRTKIFEVGALVIAGWMASALGGCCGVGPDPDYSNVNDEGAVQFDPTTVGATETLSIPIEDSADVDETITSAKLVGPNASEFRIASTFPIFVPAGTSVQVDVVFAPTDAGHAAATIEFQTEMMGPSPVDLVGDAEP